MLNNNSLFDKEVIKILKKYKINKVQILLYNLRVNKIVKRRHKDLKETLLKLVKNNTTK